MALALLDDDSIPHPRLEVVLTTEEEIGMLGAAVLDVTPLQGRELVNLDSEAEGVFTVGCAGGSSSRCVLPIHRAAFEGACLRVQISGLTGGHSGTEIHKGRANADMLMGRMLRAMAQATPVRLVSVDGGLKDNAIATAAEAVVCAADVQAASQAAEELGRALAREYAVPDPNLTVTVEAADCRQMPMDEASTAPCAVPADLRAQWRPGHESGYSRTGTDLFESGYFENGRDGSLRDLQRAQLRGHPEGDAARPSALPDGAVGRPAGDYG